MAGVKRQGNECGFVLCGSLPADDGAVIEAASLAGKLPHSAEWLVLGCQFGFGLVVRGVLEKTADDQCGVVLCRSLPADDGAFI